ncbi:putative oxoglutarate/iron-dependent dioxygenase, non-hem dioxygenase domain-containing protein [Helianthus debilis subsp. tardiflorus]
MEMKEDKDARWFELECLPNDYILLEENRPQNLDSPVCDSIPVIDLAKPNGPVEEILKGSQEFGFFQVINHGIPEKTVIDAMNVLKEFFDMQGKDAPTGTILDKKGYIYNRSDYARDGTHLWRENLKHPCHPLEKCTHLWPDTPTRYQEVIATYLGEIQKLSSRILEMIGEGLGLEQGYFKNTSEVQLLSSNFYPPCVDPSLTLGVPPHFDTSLITLVFQGSSTGLQFIKDGQWMNVGASPNAFVVNIGNQLEIISNRKLKSVRHRVVTSTRETRLSIATFVNPSLDCIVEPAKVLVNELEPSLYVGSQYKDYVQRTNAFGAYSAAILNAMQ